MEEVATPGGWAANRELVLQFYNERRAGVRAAMPNAGHLALARLDSVADVRIITQNIDDLHERAGSANVLHLHGEIMKSRATCPPYATYRLGQGEDIHLGDVCPRGSQLRPHVVWFGEPVPAYGEAEVIVRNADIVIVVGTGMQVYPAAGLVDHAPAKAQIFVVNPDRNARAGAARSAQYIHEGAATGLPALLAKLFPGVYA